MGVEGIHHLLNLGLRSQLSRVSRFFYLRFLSRIRRCVLPTSPQALVCGCCLFNRVQLDFNWFLLRNHPFIHLVVIIIGGSESDAEISTDFLSELMFKFFGDGIINFLIDDTAADLMIGFAKHFVVEKSLQSMRVIWRDVFIDHRCHFVDRNQVQSAVSFHFLFDKAVNHVLILVGLHSNYGWASV